ncbi:MFS transporter [Pantoea cypripedii]|uniref:MFS transporter n=1 Tax=Pantoea cypripedii TaxID=55209 RepID=A0A6B9GFF9_PANCY|nr:MFS transporter [Pantoea cypripedii]QGY32419.1 MFS transporter [Pantoea cypripedii]
MSFVVCPVFSSSRNPVVAVTRTFPRRPLYVILVLTFAVANMVTAFSTSYALTAASRVLAGLAAGVAWPVICGYAISLVAPSKMGRAVAITLAGSTIAMVAGLPVGTLLGVLLGWRYCFALLSILAFFIVLWVLATVPSRPGENKKSRDSVYRVIRTQGLLPILITAFFTILAHYNLYTYMAPLAESLRLPGSTTGGLLLFGFGALSGVIIAGRYIDKRLRILTLAALICTALMMMTLWSQPHLLLASPALFLWGASFGAMPTVFQSATGRVAGSNAELATAMLTTVYNLGIFGGGAVGGLVISHYNVLNLTLVSLFTIAISLLIVVKSNRYAFPKTSSPANYRSST